MLWRTVRGLGLEHVVQGSGREFCAGFVRNCVIFVFTGLRVYGLGFCHLPASVADSIAQGVQLGPQCGSVSENSTTEATCPELYTLCGRKCMSHPPKGFWSPKALQGLGFGVQGLSGLGV